jgi:hypothetical protein
MFQTAGRMGRLVLEIEIDARGGLARQVDPDEVGVGRAVEVGFDQPGGVRDPVAVGCRDAVVAGFVAGRRRVRRQTRISTMGGSSRRAPCRFLLPRARGDGW